MGSVFKFARVHPPNLSLSHRDSELVCPCFLRTLLSGRPLAYSESVALVGLVTPAGVSPFLRRTERTRPAPAAQWLGAGLGPASGSGTQAAEAEAGTEAAAVGQALPVLFNFSPGS